MKQEDIDMVEKILDTEYVGYAYIYLEPHQPRKEHMLTVTPENLANFIGSQGAAAKQIMVTDMLNRPIVDTILGMVNDCPDQKLCRELVGHLAPIQMGEKEAGPVLSVKRDVADQYFAVEDQAVAMAEFMMG